MKFTYGNNKGGIKSGSNMLTSQTGFSGYDYSGEHVSGEVLAVTSGAVDAKVLHTPIKPGTVVLSTPDDVSLELHDVPNADGITGTFTDTASTGLGAGTVNYVTGDIKLTGVTQTNVEMAFDYDQNSFDAPVDEVDVRVVSEPVVARPRKLKSVYMFDVGYDLKMSFGLDMDQIILKATSGEIGYEIAVQLLHALLSIKTLLHGNKSMIEQGISRDLRIDIVVGSLAVCLLVFLCTLDEKVCAHTVYLLGLICELCELIAVADGIGDLLFLLVGHILQIAECIVYYWHDKNLLFVSDVLRFALS